MTADPAPQVRRLDLRMGIPDIGGPPDVYPVLTILIDGQDLLTGPRGYIGPPPAVLLDDKDAGGLNRARADVPDLVFDADQYFGEIQRASSAREWESEPWRTALLADQFLSPDRWFSLAGSVWDLGWIQPSADRPGQFDVTCWDTSLDRGIALTLRPRGTTVAERAAYIADFLRTTPAELWPVTRKLRRNARGT